VNPTVMAVQGTQVMLLGLFASFMNQSMPSHSCYTTMTMNLEPFHLFCSLLSCYIRLMFNTAGWSEVAERRSRHLKRRSGSLLVEPTSPQHIWQQSKRLAFRIQSG
jgi:hypothetical protein